jgi:DNA polymerase-3 subunit delta'
LCDQGGARACGACSACRRALTLSDEEPRVPLHPDLVFVARGLYKKTLGAAEASGISIEQVRRVVLARVGFPPHEGRALVFIVEDADELTASAANALLKTLEEPGPATHFLLLTSRPNRLLDTIRSRTLPVRFAPLSDAIVARILEQRGLTPAAAPLAQGSASLALELASDESLKEREEFAQAARAAIGARDLAAATRLGDSKRYDRETLQTLLAYFAQSLALAARLAQQHRVAMSTIQDVERNMQPALALEAMIFRMREIEARF